MCVAEGKVRTTEGRLTIQLSVSFHLLLIMGGSKKGAGASATHA
jgi:hypothetical protein